MKQLIQTLKESHIIVALGNQAIVIAVAADVCSATPLEAPDADATMIQAVALTQLPDGSMTYAVARSSKQLQIFRDKEMAASYVTPKRVSSMCFALVADDQHSMTVVVVSDLAGDAIAYSVEKGLNDSKDDEKNQETNCRLLLGHTASMLTKVLVHQHYIVTADRDEKIRVSYFPDTYRIHGYLLGHLAFVSSFDVHNNACASAGGDRMIRLWDLVTCKELASISTVSDENANDQSIQPIPTSILWDALGNYVAVIYDDAVYVDFFVWQNESISHATRVECQAQPLGLARRGSSQFLLLIRDPPYLQELQMDSTTDKSHLMVAQTTQSRIRHTLEESIQKLEITDIPQSVLERDNTGNVTIEKHSETRGPTHTKPWENVSRVETAKARNRRFKRRKRGSYSDNDEEEDAEGDVTIEKHD
ncbi:tRNA (guanine-N(7)-)-methyltransferase subunit TRM82 [Fistulifera solaris]|uniref:tRNA (Guanine-N(7)-)-methyltransferase subunit TRM82 n=1 Tax=Fistulifera solaris TaxID=1519565 RepID=A0A1Z5JHL1_FISSO|nr:tRNA (guanine-N(7)-)-methyltransferase subunit TRM82 [Fistulifera solaris]|eukprot:GAX13495.1 tRNA (guanine-N(7)-)-methyltransferase subunit TRM82 [Fistulifera solaris]